LFDSGLLFHCSTQACCFIVRLRPAVSLFDSGPAFSLFDSGLLAENCIYKTNAAANNWVQRVFRVATGFQNRLLVLHTLALRAVDSYHCHNQVLGLSA